MLIALSVIPEQINPLSVVCCWAQWMSQQWHYQAAKTGDQFFTRSKQSELPLQSWRLS